MGAKSRLRAARREALRPSEVEARQNLSVSFSVDDTLDEDENLAPTEVVIEEDDKPEVQDEEIQPVTEVDEPEDDGEDPLEALKRQFANVRAEKEAAERRAREHEQRAKENEQRLYQQQFSELGSHKAVLEQAYTTEEMKLSDAKRKYAEALANRDFEAAADAQLAMTRSDSTMQQYSQAYQELERREKAPKQAPTPVQQTQSVDTVFEQALSTMEPRVAAWAREHKADVLKPDRQELALLADSLATRKGLQPGSDEYLDFMDEQMGYLAPEAPQSVREAPKPKPVPVQQKTARRAVAAPSSRVASSGGSLKVALTQDDLDMATSLKMSPQEYAKYKIKANEGQLTQAQAGGRLHARYS